MKKWICITACMAMINGVEVNYEAGTELNEDEFNALPDGEVRDNFQEVKEEAAAEQTEAKAEVNAQAAEA